MKRKILLICLSLSCVRTQDDVEVRKSRQEKKAQELYECARIVQVAGELLGVPRFTVGRNLILTI